ncbi:class I SAM-dependent methyltransferase [Hyphococcus sp.]|uniref:class I SAM-dependent methyltransferase n=1 Tax=Hyphococcus sp. TaxID=2038636 RepID=UPI003D0C7C06
MTGLKSNAGYASEAEDLLQRYEALAFEEVHAPVLHLLPERPTRILEIGSGTGRDAAVFAKQGHQVTAVEPTDELRIPAMSLHPDSAIEWIGDSLPSLAQLKERSAAFDIIMLTAVWMHLDADERAAGMKELSRLATPGAKIFFLLRHGPVPPGRRMFEVSGEETEALAAPYGFSPVFSARHGSLWKANQDNGVTWTRLVLARV